MIYKICQSMLALVLAAVVASAGQAFAEIRTAPARPFPTPLYAKWFSEYAKVAKLYCKK